MRNFVTRSAFCLLFVFFLAGMAGAEEKMLLVQRLGVEDGDTLLITIEGQQQRVQIRGIDAPEDSDNPKYQHDLARTGLEKERLLALGKAATDYLRQLAESKAPFSLHYNPQRRDRYDRLTGDIDDSQGHSLAESMVAAGYAMVTDKDSSKLQQLQGEAQTQGLGLWGRDPEGARAWSGKPPPAP